MGLIFSRLFYRVILTVFLVFFSSSNFFAQSENSELKELTETSDLIVVGKIAEQKSSWNETKTRIYTRVSVQTDEYLKGTAEQKQLVITKPGGEVGDVGELYSHIPEFEKDEEVLLFLKKDKNDRLYVNNGTHGKYTIKSNNSNGIKMISESKSLENYMIKIKSFVKE